MRRRWGIVSIFIGLVFIASGWFVFHFTYGQYRLSREAKEWPTTEGKILSSKVVNYFSKSGKKKKLVYGPRISFEYFVNGVRYESHTIAFTDLDSSNPKEVQKIARKYTPGKKVIVYYDPKAPSIAVLEPGRIGKTTILGLVLGGSFIVIGVWLTIKSIISTIRRFLRLV